MSQFGRRLTLARWAAIWLSVISITTCNVVMCDAKDKGQPLPSLATVPQEANANSEEVPKQILRSGVQLNSKTIAPNSRQLADEIGLTPILEKMQAVRSKYSDGS